MDKEDYWLDLFSGTTWQEFLKHGAHTSGFRENRWNTVQQIKPGDYLLCYLTGISRFVGILRVTSEAYQDETPIWQDAIFPSRLHVEPVVTLTPETAIPIQELKDRLTIFENLQNPNAWIGHLRGSPARWKRADGKVILEVLQEAKQNPKIRPVDKRKLQRKAPILSIREELLTPPAVNAPIPELITPKVVAEDSEHTEVQYLLLRLGIDMGFDVWAARNDRNRNYQGRPMSEHIKLKTNLPLQFNEKTTRTIELIDVLWLKSNAIVAAFEIESTTSIYSGLLRMSDLVAMQPNLNIPLYLVAPEERRDRVIDEVNRPTFERLPTPLANVCQYISFSTLKQKLAQVGSFVRYLKSDFIVELAEPCIRDDV